MQRLVNIFAQFGLRLAAMVAMLGGKRRGTRAAEPRRLFDTIPGPEGRERTLFQTIDFEQAGAEPALEPAVTGSPRLRGRGRRVAVVAVVVSVVALVASLAAVAFWTTGGSGSATASVGTLTAPGQPTRTGSGATVDLDWTASTVSGGGTVSYHVERTVDPGSSWVDACSTTVLTPITAITCIDSPAAGTYRYRVTAIYSSWTALGPESTAFTVTGGDTTPPMNSLSLVSQSPAGSSLLSGGTVYYRGTGGGSGGSFVIRNAVSDGDSGPASSTTAALGGTTAGWSHTPSTVSTPAGGPYDSNAFTWAEGTTSSPTEVVTGADVAGNPAAEPTLTFVDDSTGPTGGALTVNGQSATGGGASGYSTSTGFLIDARTEYATDAGSGFASSVLTVQSFVLASTGGILNGTCGAPSTPFAAPTVVSGTTQPGGIVTALCYTYTLTGTDNLGNTSSISTTVKVDTTAPNAPTLSLSAATGNTFISGTTAYINAQAGKSGSFAVSAIENDLQSGIQSVDFPLLTGFTSGGGLDTTSGYSSGTYSWSGAVGASGPQTVTGTNYAGLTNSSPFTVTPDTAAPVSGALSVNNQVATSGGSSGYSTSATFLISPRTDYTDPGSGLASSVLTVQSFVLSSSDGSAEGTCAGVASGPFASPTIIGGTFQPPGIVTGYCYTYTLTGTDNVANTASISTTVKVDTTAPSAPVITLTGATGNTFINGLTVFINAQAGRSGSFSASATTTDNESGIVRVVFPTLAGFTTGGGSDLTSPYVTPATYTWSGAVGATGAQAVSVPNFAGLAPATSTFTVTPDINNPTGGVIQANSSGSASYNTSGTIALAITNYSDAGSGILTNAVTRAAATYTPATGCGTFSGSTPVVGASDSGLADGCYRYTLTGTDNVGNSTNAQSAIVTVDKTAPTVTINQASGQADPTNASAINFTVVFSESTSNFATGDVALAGGAGATTATVTGSGTTYNVAVSGMTAQGTVIASSNAAVATDAAGNANTASTSTDNTVTRDTQAPAPSSITLINGTGGTTAGLIDTKKDSLNVVYSELISPSTFCSTWTTDALAVTGTPITVTITNNAANDTLTLTTPTNCGGVFKFGTIELAGNYVTATATFGGSGGNASNASWDAGLKKLTIDLGALATGTLNATAQAAAAPSYTPDAALTDLAGNAIVTTRFTTGSASRF